MTIEVRAVNWMTDGDLLERSTWYLAFGFYPARKASRLDPSDPIEALRYE